MCDWFNTGPDRVDNAIGRRFWAIEGKICEKALTGPGALLYCCVFRKRRVGVLLNMKSYVAKTGEVDQKWVVVDADGQILGRLAVKIAMILMGKTKPIYTPHVDTGDFVVVVNAEKIEVSGKKAQTKEYQRYTGYPGGQKSI